jgi:ABC-2 type transport system permease protein
MSVFIEAVRQHMKVFMRYKSSYLITLVLIPLLMLINISLFKSIYSFNQTVSIKGYTLEQMVWYYTTVNFVFVFIWNFTHTRISEKILSGDLVIDLLRPISLFRSELAHAVALRLVGILLEFVPNIFLYSLIIFPSFITPLSLIRFFIIIIFAFVLYYMISFLIGLLAFIVKNNMTVIALKEVVITALGGVFIPLEFLPGGLNRVLDFLPFKYIFYWPIQVFLNKGNTGDWRFFFEIVGVQIIWSLFFYILCRLLWKRVVKQFCAAGG